MPIYEYHCEGCGGQFEVMQRITAPPVEACELCGEGPVHKLISQSTFILKGSGWYVTDYGRGNGKGKDNHTATGRENTGDQSHSSKDSTTSNKDSSPASEGKAAAAPAAAAAD
jgi:putative FmdB family regulatory protein